MMKRLFTILLAFVLIFVTSFSVCAATVDIEETGDGVVITSGDWSYQPLTNYGYKIVKYLGEGPAVELPYAFAKQYVTEIADYAFYQKTSVTSVTLSSVLENVDEYAFHSCSGLQKVVFYPSTTSVGMGCFYNCSSLSDVNLQDSSVTVIPDYCFANSGLSDLQLPDICTSIGNYAFYQCSSLQSLLIPASVTNISDNAFYGCDALTIYCYSGSAAHTYAVEKDIPFVLLDADVYFTKHSISLNGDIVINFYVNVPDAYVNSGRAKVDFSWTVDGVEYTHSDTLAPDDKTSIGYKAACPVAIAEMTCGVTAKVLVDNAVCSFPDTYSAVTYANKILTDTDFAISYVESENNKGRNGDQRLIQLQTLVKTMLDYGSKAQIRFNCNTDDLANGGTTDFYTGEVTISSGASDMEEYLEDCGLEYYGTSVIYLSKTTLRHYYKIKDSSKFTAEIKNGVTFNGEHVTYGTKNGLIYFDKPNIAASQLDTEYVFVLNGHEYQYSALDYSALAYSLDDAPYSSSITKQLAAAVYRYNQAANVFFNE